MVRARAFTLVEILIVVVLLGVLAAIVVPAIGNCGSSARASSMATNLNMLRRFVLVYTSHHLEVAPGYTAGPGSAVDADVFAAQALLSSDAERRHGDAGDGGLPIWTVSLEHSEEPVQQPEYDSDAGRRTGFSR